MKEKLFSAFASLGNTVFAAMPKVAVGLLLLVLGLFAAKLIEVVLRTMLVRLRFDNLVEKAGIDQARKRIGLRQQLNLFRPKLAYFLVLFRLAKTASEALGLRLR